jgi:Glycosyl hydrolase catalytic core
MRQGRKRPRGWVRVWVSVLTAALALSLASASTALAIPANFWGVSPQAIPTMDEFKRLKAGGVDSVRIPIGWDAVQPVQGASPSWSAVDQLVRGAASAEIDVLPFLSGAPPWAVAPAAVPGSGGKTFAPKTLPVRTAGQRVAWSSFLQLVVARYGPSGSFWTENPSVPARPIRTWQIWNEQNFKYFVVRPNPAEYGKLLKISYTAIKGIDPGAQLILGGMFAEPNEATFRSKPPQAYFATDFLDRLYESTPGIKSKFSGVALHPYTGRYQELTEDIEEFRAVLLENGDAAKSLWITEIGWSSQYPAGRDGFAKGPNGQVKQLNGAFNLFKRKQAKWRLKRIYWFSVDDQPGSCNFCDGTGLFGAGFVPKLSWFAYVKFAGGSAG